MFKRKDFISIKELSKEEILFLLQEAKAIKNNATFPCIGESKILGLCFFEPSTRTRLSFEAAMKRLKGECIGFSESKGTSTDKGESLSDTIRVIGGYADLIVLRHPLEGAARLAARATDKPVINAGDGANEHPTQTLLDLFTLEEAFGRLDGLNLILGGDLKHSRTVHSLALACRHFNVRLFFVSPKQLEMPASVCEVLRGSSTPFSFHNSFEEVIERADVLYMTRIQEERFTDRLEYEQTKPLLRVTEELVQMGKRELKILHPLPRLEEIDRSVDATPYAAYFSQAKNGIYVRAALIKILLEGSR